MAAAAEAPFVYAFAALLAGGAVFALFVPLLRHVRLFGTDRTGLVAIVVALLGLSVAAIVVVVYTASDPAYLVPIAAVTVGLRIGSPSLLYQGLRDRFEARRNWSWIRSALVAGYLVFAAGSVYNLVRNVAGQESSVLAGVSEQFAMALGATALIVRMAFRFHPRFDLEWWPAWTAATLISVAFVVVAPYAFPAFSMLYLISGIIGWIVGAFVGRRFD